MVKDLCFEVIEKCLNNCKFCSSNSNCNKNQIIEFKDFKRVIDYFMNNGGIEELSISGGEPFLHPDILKMVEYSKSLGIKTVIFTSGVIYQTPITEEEKNYYISEMNKKLKEVQEHEPDNIFLQNKIRKHYENLMTNKKYGPIPKETLRKLKELGLDKIVFDVQAYELETDNSIMGRNMEARLALLDSILNATSTNLYRDVHFVPMKPNYKEIKDLLELLEIVKVDQISFLNFLPQGRGRINKEQLQLTEEEKEEFFKILENSKNYFSGKIRIGIPLQQEETHKCNAGLEKLDIKFDGTIRPCPAFKEITLEECKKYNIKIPNIYTNLEEVKIPGIGTRKKPLCKQIYESRKVV